MSTVIDVHTHMLDNAWVKLLEKHGGKYTMKAVYGGLRAIHLDGAPFMTPVPEMFDWELRIKNMDRVGIDVAVTSLSCPNVFWGGEKISLQAAQIMKGLLGRRRWGVAAPQIGPVDFGGDGFKHRRQLGRIELIEVAAHQRQSQPQLVVAAQGGHGAAHLGGLQAISPRQSTEKAQHLNQGQEGVPVAIRAEVQQLLALLDLQLQLLHAAAMLLELAAVAPAVGRMQLQAFLQLMHLLGLVLHLTGQVVLGRGHVVATGHRGHRQGQAATGLVAMADLTGVV